MVDSEIKQILDELKIKFELNVGVGLSVEQLLTSEQPLIELLLKGLVLKFGISTPKNLFKVLIDFLNKTPQLAPFMMQFLPLTLIETKASFEATFDSWDDVKDLPQLESFLPSFMDLVSGMLQVDLSDVGEDRIDLETSKLPDDQKLLVEAVHLALDLFGQLTEDGEVSVVQIIGDLGGSRIQLKSQGLGKAVQVGLNHFVYKGLRAMNEFYQNL